MPKDIELFISHAHKDKKLADELVSVLTEGTGIDTKEIRCTSVTPTGLSPGSKIAKRLRKDLENCRYSMPLITKNLPGSEFVLFEIGAAWMWEIETLPVVYKMKAGQPVPSVLSGLLSTNLEDEQEVAALLEKITTERMHKSNRKDTLEIMRAARSFVRDIKGIA